MLSIKGPSLLVGMLRNLAVALAVAVLVVVMVLLATAGTGLVERLHVNATLLRIALPLLLVTMIVLICASVFRVLGGERVSWRAALAGGGVSGVILMVTPTLAGYYTRWVASNAPVRLFLVRGRADHLLHRGFRGIARNGSGGAPGTGAEGPSGLNTLAGVAGR